jgi:hypothetical protein
VISNSAIIVVFIVFIFGCCYYYTPPIVFVRTGKVENTCACGTRYSLVYL